jgi:hypothetical protein
MKKLGWLIVVPKDLPTKNKTSISSSFSIDE